MSKSNLTIFSNELQYNSCESTISQVSHSSSDSLKNLFVGLNSFSEYFKKDSLNIEYNAYSKESSSNSGLEVETCISFNISNADKPQFPFSKNYLTLLNTLTDSTQNTNVQSNGKLLKFLKHKSVNTLYQLNIGNFTNIIKSRNGSTSIQKYLDSAPPKIISKILMEILFDIPALMTDHFGNYICVRNFTKFQI
jgi:hypothetical protein